MVIFCHLILGRCSFASVVERSLSLEQTRQAWCDSCTRYQPIEQSRRYKTLPKILAMNCGLDSSQVGWQKLATLSHIEWNGVIVYTCVEKS